MKKMRGFTLIEMTLSIAVLAIIAALIIPVSQTLQNNSNLKTATQSVVLGLRQAHTFAMSGKNDTDWGVYLPSGGGSIIIFEGSSYAGGEEYEEITFTETIIPTGDTEIIFQKRTGTISNDSTITLTNTTNDTQIISINEKGVVLY